MTVEEVGDVCRMFGSYDIMFAQDWGVRMDCCLE